ncbi:MAG: SOS response-associated peptidase [Bacteroidia bacterium]|nr:SOS response-associated peptidase [Bacteroidia bacterium]
MCFYYSLSKLAQRYSERAKNNEILRETYMVNGFSHPEMPVITETGMELMNWGLIPTWSKDDQIRKYTLNARAETIFEKPSFKNVISSKRCIIPATGYFEWQHNGKNKQPYFISLKNQDAFTFAGVWDLWVNPQSGETLYSYSIITTEANPLLAEIHNTKKRMPVVLPQEIEFDWLTRNLSNEKIKDFFVPLGDEYFNVQKIDLNPGDYR